MQSVTAKMEGFSFKGFKAPIINPDENYDDDNDEFEDEEQQQPF